MTVRVSESSHAEGLTLSGLTSPAMWRLEEQKAGGAVLQPLGKQSTASQEAGCVLPRDDPPITEPTHHVT